MKEKIKQLFFALMRFGKYTAPDGTTLVFEGDQIVVGTEVFIQADEYQPIPAPDNIYGPYKVSGGVVTEIADENEPVTEIVEQEAEETPVDEEKENLIKENEELKAKIAELEAKIAELEEKKEISEQEKLSAENQVKELEEKEQKKGFARYFE